MQEAHPLAGRYRFLRRLSAGPPRTVWLAEDLENNDLVIAAQGSPRLVRQWSDNVGIEHTHLATLFDIVSSIPNEQFPKDAEQDPESGIALSEWTPGATLYHGLQNSPLSMVRAVQIVAKITRAVSAIHKKGGYHGAISSRSVVVERLDDKRSPVLTQVMVPADGRFASPERLFGRGPSQADDVWALHVLLYLTLTGRTPFRGRTREGLIRAVRSTQPLPLNAFDVNDGVLQGILDHGLLRERDKRVRHVEDLDAMLTTWVLSRGEDNRGTHKTRQPLPARKTTVQGHPEHVETPSMSAKPSDSTDLDRTGARVAVALASNLIPSIPPPSVSGTSTPRVPIARTKPITAASSTSTERGPRLRDNPLEYNTVPFPEVIAPKPGEVGPDLDTVDRIHDALLSDPTEQAQAGPSGRPEASKLDMFDAGPPEIPALDDFSSTPTPAPQQPNDERNQETVPELPIVSVSGPDEVQQEASSRETPVPSPSIEDPGTQRHAAIATPADEQRPSDPEIDTRSPDSLASSTPEIETGVGLLDSSPLPDTRTRQLDDTARDTPSALKDAGDETSADTGEGTAAETDSVQKQDTLPPSSKNVTTQAPKPLAAPAAPRRFNTGTWTDGNASESRRLGTKPERSLLDRHGVTFLWAAVAMAGVIVVGLAVNKFLDSGPSDGQTAHDASNASALTPPRPSASQRPRTQRAATSTSPAKPPPKPALTPRPPKSVSTCIAGLFPDKSFRPEQDLSRVCREPDPRKGMIIVRRFLVQGSRGKLTAGMNEWSRMSWFQLPAYGVLRHACCGGNAALQGPPPKAPCGSPVQSADEMARQILRDPVNLAPKQAIFVGHATCVQINHSRHYRMYKSVPMGGGQVYFNKFLHRVRVR